MYSSIKLEWNIYDLSQNENYELNSAVFENTIN